VVRLPEAAPAPVAVAFVEEIAEPPLEQPAVEAALEPVATDIFVPEVVVETPVAPPPVVTVTEVPLPPQAVAAPPAAARGGGDAAVTPPDFSADQLNNPGPRYPAASRRAREEGTVMLKVLVSPDGRAQELAVQTSSGFKRLDEAALATVRRWAFLPAKKAGQPVPAWVLVPVTFALG
jgi:protein TonB